MDGPSGAGDSVDTARDSEPVRRGSSANGDDFEAAEAGCREASSLFSPAFAAVSISATPGPVIVARTTVAEVSGIVSVPVAMLDFGTDEVSPVGLDCSGANGEGSTRS